MYTQRCKVLNRILGNLEDSNALTKFSRLKARSLSSATVSIVLIVIIVVTIAVVIIVTTITCIFLNKARASASCHARWSLYVRSLFEGLANCTLALPSRGAVSGVEHFELEFIIPI